MRVRIPVLPTAVGIVTGIETRLFRFALDTLLMFVLDGMLDCRWHRAALILPTRERGRLIVSVIRHVFHLWQRPATPTEPIENRCSRHYMPSRVES